MIFNRPDTTARVFAEIRKARPIKLLVVADGPREDHPADHEKCQQARAIIDRVDWICEVLKNYSDVNLGCKRRVSSGLDWVFDTVDKAIILEDDVLPNPTFFRFCEELLDRYEHDERVGLISGDNFNIRPTGSESYCFSIFPLIWGWATWARAWRCHDQSMSLWPEVRETEWLGNLLGGEASRKYWQHVFDKVFQERIDTWDYQWTFSCWQKGFLSIVPATNLVSNIGFGPAATHTTESDAGPLHCDVYPMQFPLSHPKFVKRDTFADNQIKRRVFGIKSFPSRVMGKPFRTLKGLMRFASRMVRDLALKGRNR
jgi:hypothetical protein